MHLLDKRYIHRLHLCLFLRQGLIYSADEAEIHYVVQMARNSGQSSCLSLWSTWDCSPGLSDLATLLPLISSYLWAINYLWNVTSCPHTTTTGSSLNSLSPTV